jgi:hypothetical protein
MKTISADCHLTFQADFLTSKEAQTLYDELINDFDITNKVIPMVDGSEFIAETGSYFFMDEELTSFDCFSRVWGGRAPWTKRLAKLRDNIEKETGIRFHVARCIYYLNGNEGVDFHSDLPAYGATKYIASISLGAEREFILRKKGCHDDTFKLNLPSGSLLFMGEGCQESYEHTLPRDKNCKEARINLTFRRYGYD